MLAQIDNQIFHGLKTELGLRLPGVSVVDVFQNDKELSGEVVTFYEADYQRTETTLSYKDPIALMMFQIDIYTEGNGKRTRSRKIQEEVDRYMFEEWHMKLITKRALPHVDGIFRVTMQYQALIREETKQLLSLR